ncbi:(+)-larreatricin hydroxylase chloroplastic [Bienertia sinuspersici]
MGKISCNAAKNDDQQNPKVKTDVETNTFDRRNMLIGLGGLYGAATTLSGGGPAALAKPTSPDVIHCGLAEIKDDLSLDCCPPMPSQFVDFKLPKTHPHALKIRPAAHLASDKYIEKYSKALALMKALPDSDPRSFTQQAKVHCAYCNGGYQQAGLPDLDLQVHGSCYVYGDPYRAGDAPSPGPGSLESQPHAPIHNWVGNPNNPLKEDMGNFYSAGRDPIFYAHHANCDRKMGYDYQTMELPWLKSRPTRPSRNGRGRGGGRGGGRGRGVANNVFSNVKGAMSAEIDTDTDTSMSSVTFPKALDEQVIRTNLVRPKTARTKKEKDVEEEVLIIEVESRRDVYSKFDVYVNDEDERHNDATGNLMTTNVKFGLTELMEDLGADDDEGIDVVFVPRTGTESVVIKDVRIEFLE